MKKLITTLTAFFIAAILFAQVPPAFNYQAVARNNAGVALANQTMQVRLSIRQSSTTLYSETRTVTTNALGLFNVQIGSAGANNVTGSIGAIDWGNSSAGWYALKVELDVANNNVFTDMGTQALASVPFALATETANTAKTVEGFPVATTPAPAVGDRLSWNGTAWAPVKKNTMNTVFGIISGIPSTPSGIAPWYFAGPTVTVTVTGNETIFASLAAGIYNGALSDILINVAACYENVSGGGILPFYASNFPEVTLQNQTIRTQVTGVGAVVLPAGTYRIGLGVRNKNTVYSISGGSDYVNGVVEVRY